MKVPSAPPVRAATKASRSNGEGSMFNCRHVLGRACDATVIGSGHGVGENIRQGTRHTWSRVRQELSAEEAVHHVSATVTQLPRKRRTAMIDCSPESHVAGFCRKSGMRFPDRGRRPCRWKFDELRGHRSACWRAGVQAEYIIWLNRDLSTAASPGLPLCF